MVGYQHLIVRFNGFWRGNMASEALAIDNVSMDVNVIPEPATVGMLGLGALVALLIRRVRG